MRRLGGCWHSGWRRTMRAEPDSAGVLSEVSPLLGGLFEALERIAVRAAREFADHSTALPEQLNELDPFLIETLLAHGELAAGIGIVLDPQAVAGRERWLQWSWHTAGRPSGSVPTLTPSRRVVPRAERDAASHGRRPLRRLHLQHGIRLHPRGADREW